MARVLFALFLAAAMLLGADPAVSETYPARQVHMVVTFPPGGNADTIARLVADKLTQHFRQPVMVEVADGDGRAHRRHLGHDRPKLGIEHRRLMHEVDTGRFADLIEVKTVTLNRIANLHRGTNRPGSILLIGYLNSDKRTKEDDGDDNSRKDV